MNMRRSEGKRWCAWVFEDPSQLNGYFETCEKAKAYLLGRAFDKYGNEVDYSWMGYEKNLRLFVFRENEIIENTGYVYYMGRME